MTCMVVETMEIWAWTVVHLEDEEATEVAHQKEGNALFILAVVPSTPLLSRANIGAMLRIAIPPPPPPICSLLSLTESGHENGLCCDLQNFLIQIQQVSAVIHTTVCMDQAANYFSNVFAGNRLQDSKQWSWVLANFVLSDDSHTWPHETFGRTLRHLWGPSVNWV